MANIFLENTSLSIGAIVSLFGIIAAHRLITHRERKNRTVDGKSFSSILQFVLGFTCTLGINDEGRRSLCL
jgi:hypothetical protein